MKNKINERTLTKTFLQNAYSKGVKYNCSCGDCPLCRTQKRMIKENMMQIGGIGFGSNKNGFSNSSYSSLRNSPDMSFDFELDDSSFGEDHAPWEESIDEPHNMMSDSWSDNDFQPGDIYDTSHMDFNDLESSDNCDECDDDLESNYYMHGEQGAAREKPEFDHYGNITPQDLYNHFDLNGDGVVSKDEYQQHVNFHCRHPELFDQYEDMKSYSSEQCHDPQSYCVVGDSLMSDYDDILSALNPIMQKTGATCHASTARALSDVLCMLKDSGLID
jgi:hypothetical protein